MVDCVSRNVELLATEAAITRLVGKLCDMAARKEDTAVGVKVSRVDSLVARCERGCVCSFRLCPWNKDKQGGQLGCQM